MNRIYPHHLTAPFVVGVHASDGELQIRVYTQQKDMGHEAGLSAAEIVRRAERRIGQLIREGQAAGEIAKRGDLGAPNALGHPRGDDLVRPSDIAAAGSGIRSSAAGSAGITARSVTVTRRPLLG